MTETRSDVAPDPDLRHRVTAGADVESIAEALLAHAAATGGRLTSAEVGERLEAEQVSPAAAKKLLRTLAESGALAFDESTTSPTRRPRVVAAARTGTTTTTSRVPASDAPPAPADGDA